MNENEVLTLVLNVKTKKKFIILIDILVYSQHCHILSWPVLQNLANQIVIKAENWFWLLVKFCFLVKFIMID